MNEMDRMKELRQQGFYCSQILMVMGLEMQGKTNPDLIGAIHGLAGGLGFSGELCGGLTGGACLLGLYAGKREPSDEEDPRLDFMVEDLVKWFKEGFGQRFGGCRCEEIIGNHPGNQSTRCPVIVAETLQKVKELLIENDFELTGSNDF
ncbi:MAG: C_GCAxxG_C_C family protein [Leptolinea sp.]|nr:C_GCAxxG_C_C family protein [Leptolinea sp.]